MADQQLFLKYFLEHQRWLKAFVFALVRDRTQAEDLFQEIALTLCRKFDDYDPQRPFPSWARGVARNKILQHYERNKREKLLFSDEAFDAIDHAYDQTQNEAGPAQEALRHCLQRLPDKSKLLLKRRYQEAMTPNEIAAAANRTLSAVHKALTRVRTALQDCIRKRLAGGIA